MTTCDPDSPVPEIEYPDSDGMPMSDNTLQFKWIVVTKEGIEAIFRDEPDVFVARRPALVCRPRRPDERMAPMSWSRSAGPRAIGAPTSNGWKGALHPQVVFEILSPGNRPGAMGSQVRVL